VPRAVTLTALNEQLLEGCRRRLGDRLRGHDETIGERLVRDVESFHSLPPAPYDACQKKPGRVSSAGRETERHAAIAPVLDSTIAITQFRS
jgi:hypothetical protein